MAKEKRDIPNDKLPIRLSYRSDPPAERFNKAWLHSPIPRGPKNIKGRTLHDICVSKDKMVWDEIFNLWEYGTWFGGTFRYVECLLQQYNEERHKANFALAEERAYLQRYYGILKNHGHDTTIIAEKLAKARQKPLPWQNREAIEAEKAAKKEKEANKLHQKQLQSLDCFDEEEE